MFTGIIEAQGELVGLRKEGTNVHLDVKAPFTSELQIDQSVAHDGVCLTVVHLDGGRLHSHGDRRDVEEDAPWPNGGGACVQSGALCQGGGPHRRSCGPRTRRHHGHAEGGRGTRRELDFAGCLIPWRRNGSPSPRAALRLQASASPWWTAPRGNFQWPSSLTPGNTPTFTGRWVHP